MIIVKISQYAGIDYIIVTDNMLNKQSDKYVSISKII